MLIFIVKSLRLVYRCSFKIEYHMKFWGGRIENDGHIFLICHVYGYSKVTWKNNKCRHDITMRVLKEKKFGENYRVTFDNNSGRY